MVSQVMHWGPGRPARGGRSVDVVPLLPRWARLLPELGDAINSGGRSRHPSHSRQSQKSLSVVSLDATCYRARPCS